MSYDNIFQRFKLYIEGVQVPFNSITINQGYGVLPTASIIVPPQAGLMDIAKYYSPKVHIFFTERAHIDTYGKPQPDIDKVLFTGIITTVNYSKGKSGSGNISIMFECVHRYHLISECLLDYSGPIRSDRGIQGTDGSQIVTSFNSAAAIQEAMAGWGGRISQSSVDDYPLLAAQTVTSTDAKNMPVDFLPSTLADYSNRLVGMPGVLINFWNQLCRASSIPALTKYQGVFNYVYRPLIEDGLQFFKRLSGHYFIESLINKGSKSFCCVGNSKKEILVPPSNQIYLMGTAQGDLTLQTLSSFMTNSGEITDIYKIFQTYLMTLDYDWLTLACPAETFTDPSNRSSSDTYAVDTIVKPGMPFYYSPSCNILYPSMYTDLQVSYDEASMPTRIDVLNNESGIDGIPGRHFRSPTSVRYSIARSNNTSEMDLAHTTATSYGAIGQFEMGRGIKLEYLQMPNWLARLASSATISEVDASKEPLPNSEDAKALESLKVAWSKRYSSSSTNKNLVEEPPTMNPFDSSSKIKAHERVLFSTADYYYTKELAKRKAGTVNCLFNPYIIPGYPMDILESSPDYPSFHAMCMSVTHSITANSLSTSISFAAAMTYTEMANYYIPFVNPYLQVSFGLTENPNLVGNYTESKNTKPTLSAFSYYYDTLMAFPVFPEQVFNFDTGMTKSVKMSRAGLVPNDGVSLGSHSFEGDLLSLCWRPIEAKEDYARRFGIKYIDLVPQNYTDTGVKYQDPLLGSAAVQDKFEIGQSQFLDYNKKTFDSINGII